MEPVDDKVPVPMGDIRVTIEQLAGNLAGLEMKKGAAAASSMRDKLVKVKIASFPFLSPEHPYFLYFETKLREFKANPNLIPTFVKKQEEEAAAQEAAANAPPTLTEQEIAQEKERRMREEQLAAAEREAKRDRTDPHPNLYSLVMPVGVSIPKATYDVMSLTAQCAAKSGVAFLEEVSKNYRNNKLFSFLNQDDASHATFQALMDSYSRILQYKPSEVQDRLEVYERGGQPLQDVFTAKGNFMTAEAARTKAAVLTDDELRRQLEWNRFEVVASYTAEDLGLMTATQNATIGHKAFAPSVSAAHVPAGAVGWGDESDNATSSGAAKPTGANSEVVGIAKRSGNSEYVKDPMTGELVHISQLQRRGNGGGASSLFGADGSTAPSGGLGGGHAGQKRDREDGLASYASFEAQLRK